MIESILFFMERCGFKADFNINMFKVALQVWQAVRIKKSFISNKKVPWKVSWQRSWALLMKNPYGITQPLLFLVTNLHHKTNVVLQTVPNVSAM